MSDNPFVIHVSESDFQQTVLEASFQRPVVVDFWADWCQPCRSLMPVLASLAEQYRGKFILAKLNTEENPNIASALGIRSLPTVRLFIKGQAVDEFMGALPEPQVRAFLDKHIPNEVDLLIAQAEQLALQGDGEQAAGLLGRAAELDPVNPRVKIGQARILAAMGQIDQAREILAGLDDNARSEPAAAALIAQIDMRQQLQDSPAPLELHKRLAADASDSEARYLLAMHALQQEDYEQALELLLELMRRDRAYRDDAARKGMLQVFDLLGGSGELVSRYRNRMFTLLH
ncbi:MAG: co-chaperone YbbN [Gammaproteobacteria bacterium SHHR-1]|nr:co-chaperone YbbN [gamma proteobacterium SS-5]